MDAAHLQLVQDYHACQAPWMLLPQLDPATRSALEACACQQAEPIEKHCRLSPVVIDRVALQAARVEAALVRSQPHPQKPNDVMPMFYIELNSTEVVDAPLFHFLAKATDFGWVAPTRSDNAAASVGNFYPQARQGKARQGKARQGKNGLMR